MRRNNRPAHLLKIAPAVFLLAALLATPGIVQAQAGGTWQDLTNGSTPSGEGLAASIIDGKIYMSHGTRQMDYDSVVLSIYDISSGLWTTGPSAGTGRSELVGIAAGGKHYAIGGRFVAPLNVVEIFDPGTNAWSFGPDMPTARRGLGAALIGYKIYVVGGSTGSEPHTGTPLDANEALDTVSNTWTVLAPMPTPMMDLYATVPFNGKVYVFGGFDGDHVSNLVQVYDPASNSWSLGTPMPTPRSNAVAGVCGGKIYVIGGCADDFCYAILSTNEAYDPTTNTWETATPKPEVACEFAVADVSTGTSIHVIGEGIFGAAGTMHEVFFCSSENTAPICDADGPYAAECSGTCSNVTLDGTGSRDPEGNSLTYLWDTGPAQCDDATVATPTCCFPSGTTSVGLTVNDGELSASCSTTVTVSDTQPPDIDCPTDVTLVADADCCATYAGPPATATDVCDAAPLIGSTQAAFCGVGPHTITWTATDGTGNSASCDQTVTLVDLTPPVLNGVPADLTVECDSVPAPAEPSATDNCDETAPIVFTESRSNGPCADTYTLTRVWTATDDSGNSSTGTQTVTVEDIQPPDLTGVPQATTVECDAVPPPAQPIATDNCDANVDVTFAESRVDGPCPDTYTLVRTWVAVDNCQNTTLATQTIDVRDSAPPVLAGVPADTTVGCDAVPAPAVPSATDNCDASPEITFAEARTDGPCVDTYTLTRTWLAVDDCGSASTGVQRVIVQDTAPPALTCGFEPVVDDDENPDEQVDRLFRVRFSGTDNCDGNPKIHGYLDVYGNDETCNDEDPDFIGFPVEDGDRVQLHCDSVVNCSSFQDECMDEEGDVPPGIVITGPAFRLHVTGADNCGNVADKECIERCPEPRGCISAITLRNSRGDEKTLYWYEFSGPKVSFEVGGETGQFTVSCSECLEVGDESGTLTVTCIQAGERLEKKCKVPEGRFSGPCP